MSVARDYALYEIDAARLPHWPAGLIKKPLPPPKDARDVALAEQIRVGVIKNFLWLQKLIEHHSGRPLKKVDPLVQKILAIGMYQLRFLTRIPARAAVDEAVEQARRFGRTKASGFVNAVLRNATRSEDPDPDDVPEHVRLSHPAQVYQRLLRVYEDEEEAVLALCRKNNAPPPLIVRLMRDRSIYDLRIDLAAGVTLTAHEQPGLVVVEGATRPLLAEWARRGIAQAQDPTSAAVVGLLDVHTAQTVLDRCAGVGTKTIQILEAVGTAGRVYAMDPNAQRCETLRRLLADRGIDNVGVIEASWLKDAAAALPSEFDRVLVDAPCSNSGVLIRRPEARYAQSAGALRSLATFQRKILADTAPFVRRGGLMVYSTCSIWPEENERIVDDFLLGHDDFELVEKHTTLSASTGEATKHHDGGFVAVLKRTHAGV
jgi:16S rRNA (cytosine967-C5)-methyltransferase